MKLLIIAPEQIPVPPPFGGSVENCIYQIVKQVSSQGGRIESIRLAADRNEINGILHK